VQLEDPGQVCETAEPPDARDVGLALVVDDPDDVVRRLAGQRELVDHVSAAVGRTHDQLAAAGRRARRDDLLPGREEEQTAVTSAAAASAVARGMMWATENVCAGSQIRPTRPTAASRCAVRRQTRGERAPAARAAP